MKKYFGESIRTLRYKVVSVVVGELELSEEAFLAEFGLQSKGGLSYGTLHQRVPSGGEALTDDDYENHCVVIHFYVGLGELIAQGKAIPNPLCNLTASIGRLAPDDVVEYMSGFRQYWQMQYNTLVQEGTVPSVPESFFQTPEKMCYHHTYETRRRISEANFRKAAFRWGVSLDYYFMYIHRLVKTRHYYRFEKGADHIYVQQIDEELHWHTGKDVLQVLSDANTHVPSDHLTPPGRFLVSQIRYELRHMKQRLQKAKSYQAISHAQFQIKFLKFQLKQVEEEYALDYDTAEREAAAAEIRSDFAKSLDKEIRLELPQFWPLVMARRRVIVLYGESSEQTKAIHDHIYEKSGKRYPETTGKSIHLSDVSWTEVLTKTGVSVLHKALVKKRKLGARLDRATLLYTIRKIRKRMESNDEEIKQILREHAFQPMDFWLKAYCEEE